MSWTDKRYPTTFRPPEVPGGTTEAAAQLCLQPKRKSALSSRLHKGWSNGPRRWAVTTDTTYGPETLSKRLYVAIDKVGLMAQKSRIACAQRIGHVTWNTRSPRTNATPAKNNNNNNPVERTTLPVLIGELRWADKSFPHISKPSSDKTSLLQALLHTPLSHPTESK